jgi:hypothetical protein
VPDFGDGGVSGAPSTAAAVALRAVFAPLAGRGSNSKPTVPSGLRTRNAENLRRVRIAILDAPTVEEGREILAYDFLVRQGGPP